MHRGIVNYKGVGFGEHSFALNTRYGAIIAMQTQVSRLTMRLVVPVGYTKYKIRVQQQLNLTYQEERKVRGTVVPLKIEVS